MDFWLLVERASLFLGPLISAVSLYYTAAPYYGWQPTKTPRPKIGWRVLLDWRLWLGILGLILIFTGWSLIEARSRSASLGGGVAQPFRADGLYLGEVVVDTSHLQSDLYIAIGFRGFNATGRRVDIRSVFGVIRYGDVADLKNLVELPPPQIIRAEAAPSFDAFKEINFGIEQRVTHAIADRMLKRLSAGERVSLDFEKLNIFVGGSLKSQSVRFPLWEAVTLNIDTVPQVRRIIIGRAEAVIGK